MAEPQSLNSMFQNAFVQIGTDAEGKYALVISGASGGTEAAPLETVIPVIARATSIRATGKQTAPGAGVAIASTAALDAGTWDVDISTAIGGTTVAATEIDNMEITHGGVAYTRIINPVPGTAGASGRGHIKYRYDGAGVISVRAAGAATAASIYAVTITCTRVN